MATLTPGDYQDRGVEALRDIFLHLTDTLLPQEIVLEHVHDVLDLNSGSGNWAVRFATAHPTKHVVGVDSSVSQVAMAEERARHLGCDNLQFLTATLQQSLPFFTSTFDLLNMQALSVFLPALNWRSLLQECYRVLRPHGLLICTEAELFITNDPAYEYFSDLYAQALWRAGVSFSPDGKHLAVTPMLSSFLQQASFSNVRQQVYACDFSVGTAAHQRICAQILHLLEQTSPFLLSMGVATLTELECLHREMMQASGRSDFCGLWYMLSVRGEKVLRQTEDTM